MTAGVIVRELSCPVCGSPHTAEADTVVVLCRHCGGLLGATNDGWQDIAERHADGIRMLLQPTRASARLLALGQEMAMPALLADRPRWRSACEESILLTAIVHPGTTRLPNDPSLRAEHVRHAVAMSEIAAFDPAVRGHMARFGQACSGLTRDDAVTTARAMLDAARSYFRALASHPDLPAGALREGAEHHARELVRSTVGGYASLLGEGELERVRVTVLGDSPRAADDVACPKCGAPLVVDPASSLPKCRYCSAITNVDADDAWTTAQLGLYRITEASLLRTDRLDGPTATLSAVGGFIHTNASGVSADTAFRFLARAIPWVTRDELKRGIDLLLLALSGAPEKTALLEAIRELARSWTCDPNARPGREPPLVIHPPTEEEEAAWIESALALWSLRRGGLLELLGHPLSTMQVAAVQEQPCGCSARAALAFFERAAPGFDRSAMRDEVTRLQPGFDHPRVATFLSELRGLLSP
jgi:ribosomal protein L37AE/L43A